MVEHNCITVKDEGDHNIMGVYSEVIYLTTGEY